MSRPAVPQHLKPVEQVAPELRAPFNQWLIGLYMRDLPGAIADALAAERQAITDRRGAEQDRDAG
jgi:hypothetical protein